MAGKVKISSKGDGRESSSHYGYQGNNRSAYGYDPFLYNYDDDVAVEELKAVVEPETISENDIANPYNVTSNSEEKANEEVIAEAKVNTEPLAEARDNTIPDDAKFATPTTEFATPNALQQVTAANESSLEDAKADGIEVIAEAKANTEPLAEANDTTIPDDAKVDTPTAEFATPHALQHVTASNESSSEDAKTDGTDVISEAKVNGVSLTDDNANAVPDEAKNTLPTAELAGPQAQNEVQNTNEFSPEDEKAKPVVEDKNTNKGGGANIPEAKVDGGGAPEGPVDAAMGQPEELKADTSNSESYVKSLTEAKSSSMVEGITHASEDIADARQNEKEDLKESLPEIDQPTGLATKESEAKDNKEEEEKAKVPDVKVQGKQEGIKINESHIIPPAKPIQVESPKAKDGKADTEAIKKFIQRLPSSDNTIDTSAGPRPQVDLKGQADPAQNTDNAQLADNEVSELKQTSDVERVKPMGENEIFPEVEIEKLKPETQLATPDVYAMDASIETPMMDAQMMAAFDEQSKVSVEEQTNAELAKAEDAKLKMEADSAKERADNEQKIQDETDKTEKLQLAEQKKAKAEVQSHRDDWKSESEELQSEFKTESETKRKETQGKIDTEVSSTEAKVDTELTQAETKANEAKKESDNEAQKKKDEAKNKKRSFWDRVADAVSSFFDKLKEALNFIFKKLREFVKKVIEAAKKAVNALIDLARKAIVGLIKAFGELLKSLVSVLLAAFPALKKKFCDLIDKAVNLACEAVNKLADALKKAVNFLLDALGKVLDAILAAYQAIYNAILDAIKFLVVGLIEIMKGITNIVISIGYAVGAVKGALVKEFIGEDVTAPLPNIEASEAELPKLAEMKELYLGGGAGAESMSENAVAGEAVLMNKTKLTDDDFEMESRIDLDPDLIKSLPEMKDGQKLELGGIPNPVTAEDLSNEVFGSQNAENTTPEAMGGNGSMDAKDAGAEGGGVDMEWLAKTDEEKLQWNIDQMGANSEMPNAKETKGAGEEKHDMPLERKTGRLGVGRRLAFVGEQMMKGMAMWWEQNRMVVYASLVGVLVAGGIIAFFTGGAGLVALLQLMLQAMTVIFAAEAVWRIKGHVFDWLGKAWKGDVQGGGESLAQAFAVLFSEFLFEYVLKGIGKVLKRIKKSLKATKVGRVLRKARVGFKRTVKKVTKPLKGVASKGGKYTLKLRQGIAKGAKKLEDLRERILTKFGFKRMWIERAGHYIELWGEFNSKVLISRTDAEGNTHYDVRDLTSADRKVMSASKHNPNVEIGHKLNDGVVVNDHYLDHLNGLDDKARKEAIDRLDSKDFDTRRTEGQVGSDSRPDFDVKAKYKEKPHEVTHKVDEKDFDAKHGDSPEVVADKKKRKAEWDASNKKKEELAKKRKDGIEERNSKEKGSDEYNETNKEKVIDVSEELGQEAFDGHMLAKGYEKVYIGDGIANDLDGVYKKDGIYSIGEAKGGSSTLGGKWTVDTKGKPIFAQQGAREYLKETIEDIKKRAVKNKDKDLLHFIKDLEKQLENGKVQYLLGRQKIKPDGSLGDFELFEFEI